MNRSEVCGFRSTRSFFIDAGRRFTYSDSHLSPTPLIKLFCNSDFVLSFGAVGVFCYSHFDFL